jgi:uncharacterized protein (TIGR03435 family)
MSYFSWYLSHEVGTPVMDGTALEGLYDFTLAWWPNPELASPGVHYSDSSEEPAIPVALSTTAMNRWRRNPAGLTASQTS